MKKVTEEKCFCIMITILMCLSILVHLLLFIMCILMLQEVWIVVILAFCIIQIMLGMNVIKNPKQLLESYEFGIKEKVENFTEEEWLEIQELLEKMEGEEEKIKVRKSDERGIR